MSLDEFVPWDLLGRLDKLARHIKHFLERVLIYGVVFLLGPGLMLFGLNSLPPPWRPGLSWPIHGEVAPATVESVHLALRHLHNDTRFDNVEASVNVALAYRDGKGTLQHARLAGPWLQHAGANRTGDAVWLYLADVARVFGSGPLEIDLANDIAAQLAVAHRTFNADEQAAGNLDRPLRWAAFAWLAPAQPLAVRYDAKHPETAIPEALIARESARVPANGRWAVVGCIAGGCLLLGIAVWNLFAFRRRLWRAITVSLVLALMLLASPLVGLAIRKVLPGVDAWSGLDVPALAADPLAPVYHDFDNGPIYLSSHAAPPRAGVAWSPDTASAKALGAWLRSLPPVPVQGGLDKAEAALTQAAIAALPTLDDAQLKSIDADLAVFAQRQQWSGSAPYDQLHAASLAERKRRGIAD